MPNRMLRNRRPGFEFCIPTTEVFFYIFFSCNQSVASPFYILHVGLCFPIKTMECKACPWQEDGEGVWVIFGLEDSVAWSIDPTLAVFPSKRQH
jgi:hypothetical protein